MIKQMICISNPCYLSLKDRQLVIVLKKPSGDERHSRAVEDIGSVLLDHPQITITHGAIRALQDNKVAIISCDERHMPASLMLPMDGHTLQSKIYSQQVQVSEPLKKNLWQQTIQAKISNQMRILQINDLSYKRLQVLIPRVLSGDSSNIEAQAAAYYWKTLLPGINRDQFGDPPNHLFNYGYAILRSMIARALVSSGCHLTIGIYHHNQYNAFALADDIMEPYRPFVDMLVMEIWNEDQNLESFLRKTDKMALLKLGMIDAIFGNHRRPLAVGVSTTTATLVACIQGHKRKIIYPRIE